MKTDALQKYVELRRRLANERSTLQMRIKEIDDALGVMPIAGAAPNSGATRGNGKRTMSPEARARIAAAQRARWAMQKRGKAANASIPNGAAKPKRRMSAAGRKAISEAARRRWAAAKAEGKKTL